ncbi:MAG: GNAT family N-acetyltransferase [Micavibrio sp.]
MFVRALDKNDWAIFKAIRLEALRLHPDRYTGRLESEALWADADWQEILSGERQRCFGLFDAGTLVGIGAVFGDGDDPSGKTAFLAMAYIREAYRGQGYSRLLYESRMQWAAESGFFGRILVGHREGNEASRRANQAFGFKPTGKEERVFGDGQKSFLHHYEVRLA